MSEAVDVDQINALSKAVLSIDGSRRVGWAKAFAAIRQLDSASQDLNIARIDRLLFREKLSYLWGFTDVVLNNSGRTGGVLSKLLREDMGVEDHRYSDNAVLDRGYVIQGRKTARALLGKIADDYGSTNLTGGLEGGVAKIRKARREKKERKVTGEERHARMMTEARARIIASYGVRSEQDLREAVLLWKRSRGAPA